ncbi:hypothetical protein [Deinococcus sp.]|uniref:hypothetical protein n=1 Tax=Deinococcus sp. TaxID=47478 RepID=UPI003B59C548
MLEPAQLLALLGQHGGREYAVRLISPAPAAKPGRARRAKPVPPTLSAPLYRLTLRGDTVQATGPSGQTRQLAQRTFLEVFGAYHFAEVAPTGQLTDLGPLFGS